MTLSEPEIGKVRLLKHIRRLGASSRIELVKATGLAKGTVTELTGAFVRQGILSESATIPRGRGRPQVSLRIVADAVYAVSLFPLTDGRVSLDVIDLNGSRIYSEERSMAGFDLATLTNRVADLIKAAVDRSGVRHDRVRHAAVILPAQLDRARGVVHWMPQAGSHNPAAIGPSISAKLGIPVTVDNRASVIARAQHWFGDEDFADDFSCIALMESGMGGARYRHGLLQTGMNGLNSEFGHVKVAFEGGRPCFCGATGCLAAYASVSGIFAHFMRERGMSDGMTKDGFAQLVVQAQAGEREAASLFATAGRALGTAVASHVNELDPGTVVIASAVPGLAGLVRRTFDQSLVEQALPVALAQTRVLFRPLVREDYWKGAASLALEQLYLQPPRP